MGSWVPFDHGSSLGLLGSEGGKILLDDEHEDGARITLESGGRIAPFSITCGVYGWMVHTRFFRSEDEARREFEEMKQALSGLVQRLNERDATGAPTSAGDECGNFVDRFP